MSYPAAAHEDAAEAPRAPGGMIGRPGVLQRFVKDQRVLFLVVGAANTLIGTLWFIAFDLLIGRRWGEYSYMVTLGFAHIASVLCAFVLYRRLVFVVTGHVWRDLGRFETVYLTALAVNAVALPVLVQGAHLEPIAAQLLIVGVTALISWFGHKHFSFRRPQQDGSSEEES